MESVAPGTSARRGLRSVCLITTPENLLAFSPFRRFSPGMSSLGKSDAADAATRPGGIVADLSEAELKVSAALSWFTHPAEVKHVAAIAGLPEDETALALHSLVHRALAVMDDRQAGALVPKVAEALRKEKPEAVAEAGERLEARAYALIMENGWINKNNRFAVLDAAWPGVAPAIPHFVAGDNDRLQDVCDALHNFLCRTERLGEWLTLFLDAEARALAAGDYDNAGWRACVAEFIHSQRGATSDVLLACAVRAVSHWTAAYQEADDQLGCQAMAASRLTSALNNLGIHYKNSGYAPAAEVSWREALRLARAHQDSESIAIACCNLAWLALDHEDMPTAEALTREALALESLPRRTALRREDVVALLNRQLAKALVQQARATEALPHARRAVDICTRLGSPDLAIAQATLAECAAALVET